MHGRIFNSFARVFFATYSRATPLYLYVRGCLHVGLVTGVWAGAVLFVDSYSCLRHKTDFGNGNPLHVKCWSIWNMLSFRCILVPRSGRLWQATANGGSRQGMRGKHIRQSIARGPQGGIKACLHSTLYCLQCRAYTYTLTTHRYQ